MANNRDEFSLATKELLANRVGRKCSNPSCQKLTCGMNSDPNKVTNIGVASHICAAAEGGPRYDANMTSEERKSYNNGIWLCQSCSKLIDTDTTLYTKELLMSWKKIAEELTISEIERNSPVQTIKEDKELIKFFLQCFDRPAFRDDICVEGHMEDFDKALEDTLIALNTGVLRTRGGSIIKQSEGKSAIQNPFWREKLNTIADKLTLMRRRLEIAKADKKFIQNNNGGERAYYYFSDKTLENWFNITRAEILKLLSSVSSEAGLLKLDFPYHRYRL